MKLAKLSLAAIVVAGLATSSFAADTLEGAFKEGKVSGALKAYWIDTNNDGATVDSDGKAVGGLLKYTTGTLNGFAAGFEFQTSHTLGGEDTNPAANDASVAIQKSLLSEAYITYTMKDTTAKIGRMHLGTPLVSDSGSRMIRDYFTGGILVNTSLPNTTLVAGMVTEHTSRAGAITKPDKPIFTVYGTTKQAGFEITGQVAFNDSVAAGVEDGTKDYYLEVAYGFGQAMPVTLAAQYIGFDTDVLNQRDSSSFGLKAEVAVGGFGLGAYYTTTDDDNIVRGGWGQGNDPSYNSIQILSGNGAGVDAYRGKVSYDFSKAGVAGLTAFTTYGVYKDIINNIDDATELDFDIAYEFGGALKGLSAEIQYAIVEQDNAEDSNNLRFMANYKF